MITEQDVIDQYNAGASMRAIHNQTGISAEKVRKILVENGVKLHPRTPHNKIILTKEEEFQIVQDYLNNTSIGQLCVKYGVKNKSTMKYLLINAGVQPRKRTNKYTMDEDFFEKIDTPIKAYVLGFLITDGCVNSNRESIEFSLALRDECQLYNIKQALKYTGPITRSYSYCNGKRFEKCSLRLTSSKLKSDLINLGIGPKKSADVKVPPIPSEYRIDLLRGLFDGDGAVGTYCGFEFCGNKYIVQWVADYCKELTGYMPKLCIDKRRKDWYRQIFIPKKYSLIIFDAMYSNTNLYLPRKKEKYIERR